MFFFLNLKKINNNNKKEIQPDPLEVMGGI